MIGKHTMILLGLGFGTQSLYFAKEPKYIRQRPTLKEDDSQSHCYCNQQNKRGTRKFKKFGSKYAAPFLAAEMIMLPHQQRVVDEKNELFDKVEKLDAFIKTNPIFWQMELQDRQLLEEQLKHMNAYWNVLRQRVEGFTN